MTQDVKIIRLYTNLKKINLVEAFEKIYISAFIYIHIYICTNRDTYILYSFTLGCLINPGEKAVLI